jgi:hypothetical protein
MNEWSLSEPAAQEREEPTWNAVREALRGMQYGTVTLIVQDGLVIQVDRTEKKRLRRGRTDK